MDFAGKVALVTGGTRGIGRGIADNLAGLGADVVVTSRSEADAASAAADLGQKGTRCKGFGADVSSFEDTNAVVKSVIEEFGGVDFLVNNAGITRDKLLLRMSPQDWNDVISINLGGMYNTIKALGPHFLKRRAGRIVNVTSVIGLVGNAGQANYAASKAGIIGLTKSIAKEFGSRGITVNAVAPGYIATSMTEQLPDEARDKMLENIPLHRLGTVEDVASVVIFLLSDMAGYITGQVINCDGGMVMQ